MPTVSLHFKQRWVQRVENGNPSMHYINQNNKRLEAEAEQAFDESVLLWRGSPFGHSKESLFFLWKDFILVTNISKDMLVTCFPVDIPYPDGIKQNVIKQTVHEIEKRRHQIRKYHDRWIPWLQRRREQRAHLVKQLDELQGRIQKVDARVAQKTYVTDKLYEEIGEYAKVLCNSLRFKQDYQRNFKL